MGGAETWVVSVCKFVVVVNLVIHTRRKLVSFHTIHKFIQCTVNTSSDIYFVSCTFVQKTPIKLLLLFYFFIRLTKSWNGHNIKVQKPKKTKMLYFFLFFFLAARDLKRKRCVSLVVVFSPLPRHRENLVPDLWGTA